MLSTFRFAKKFQFNNRTKVITSINNPFKLDIMRLNFLLFTCLSFSLFSCSNIYKATQTPDDVYYSPVREMNDLVDKEDKTSENSDDREITMSKYDSRWRTINGNYDYNYSPYAYGYGYGYYYNPYYYAYPIYNNGLNFSTINSTPRTTNLSSYQFNNTNTVNPKYNSSPVKFKSATRSYNNSNSSSSTREVIYPSSNSTNNNTRSYTPSSSSSSSSSSGSGNTISRPRRG